jgi:hypothetical protein
MKIQQYKDELNEFEKYAPRSSVCELELQDGELLITNRDKHVSKVTACEF